MRLEVNWNWSSNAFEAKNRTGLKLCSSGDIKPFEAAAQQINSHIVASHNLSYVFIRDTFIDIVNEYARFFYNEGNKNVLIIRLSTLWCNIDSTGCSRKGIDDFIAKVDDFLNYRNVTEQSNAEKAIKNFIDFLASKRGNLMWGYGTVNGIIDHRLDFPCDSFYIECGTIHVERITTEGVKVIKYVRDVTRFIPEYENKIIQLLDTCHCDAGKIAFLVTNLNGQDTIMSSQDFEMEKAFLNLSGYVLTQPSKDFNIGIFNSSKRQWRIFSMQDSGDARYSVFHL